MLVEAVDRARQGLIPLETFFRGSLEEGLQAPYRKSSGSKSGKKPALESDVLILETIM